MPSRPYSALRAFSFVTLIAVGCTSDRSLDPGLDASRRRGDITFEAMSSHVDRFFAHPDGLPGNSGDSLHPWDLATALSGGPAGNVGAGDTIFLLEGDPYEVYPDNRYEAENLVGTQAEPIIVTQYPGMRATIDRNGLTENTLATLRIDASVSYVEFRYFEVTNSDPTRADDDAGDTDLRPNSINNYASNVKFIGLILTDGGNAFSNDYTAHHVEIIGCLIYNNGWDGPVGDRAHGHGLYLKSGATDPRVEARDNIIFDQYGSGIHVYSEQTSHDLRRVILKHNVVFNNGGVDQTAPFQSDNILLGGKSYATLDTLEENLTYYSTTIATRQRNVRIGYQSETVNYQNGHVRASSNYFVNGSPIVQVGFWDQARFDGNTLIGSGTMARLNNPATTNQLWLGNLHRRNPNTDAWMYNGSSMLFNPWKTTLSSTDAADANLPGSNHAVARIVRAGHMNVVVYKWSAIGYVDVDLSGAFLSGEQYEIRNAQNFFAAPITGQYNGTMVRIYLASVQAPASAGLNPTWLTTGTDFNVFVIRKVPSTTPSPLVFQGWGYLPEWARPNKVCQFSVSVTGGTPPYSYAWTRDGAPIPKSNNNPLSHNTGWADFTIGVTVSDQNNQQVSASHPIDVSASNPFDCLY